MDGCYKASETNQYYYKENIKCQQINETFTL